MVSSSFTLAKTYRDRQLADLLKGEAAAGRESAAVDVLKGTDAWAFQVVASFVLAVGFSYHSLYFAVCYDREGWVCWARAIGCKCNRYGVTSYIYFRLVLGCIDVSDSESKLIFQHFSRSIKSNQIYIHVLKLHLSKFANFVKLS